MHRKRVTSELHDSYFRLMTIKRDVVGKATPDRGGSRKPPMQLSVEFQTVETRCGREGHTRPRRTSESPDGVDPDIRRTIKTQRDGHNSGVKIWSLRSVSSILSHANLLNPCNKMRGKYFSKEVFLCLPSCILIVPASVIPASLSLCRCELFYIYMCTYVDVNLHLWLYNTNSPKQFYSYTAKWFQVFWFNANSP